MRIARVAVTVAIAALLPPLAHGQQDPTSSDPDKYKTVLENERVRVLRYHDHPGEKTHLHAHPDLVLYALAPFKRRLHVKDGKSWEREFTAGEVFFVPAQAHIGENIGTTDTEVLIVELKEPRPGTAAVESRGKAVGAKPVPKPAGSVRTPAQ